jgi:tetratricopeptide (TPR) repeat protein
MTSPMDPAEVKALMQSSDTGKIEETVRSFDDYYTETQEDEQQLLKLRILLWNRILALQRAALTDYSEALCKIGQCWIGMGETDKAIGFLVKALEMKPDDAVSLEHLAVAYTDLSHYEKAIELREKAISLREKESDKMATALAYAKLANTYDIKGDFAQSIALFKKADATMKEAGTADTEEEGLILSQMGGLLEKVGEYEQAVEALTRAHKVYVALKGEEHPKTEEIAFLLEMASNLIE